MSDDTSLTRGGVLPVGQLFGLFARWVLSMEGEQEKQHGVLFFASDKLENLLLRYRASEGTVTTALPARKGNV